MAGKFRGAIFQKPKKDDLKHAGWGKALELLRTWRQVEENSTVTESKTLPFGLLGELSTVETCNLARVCKYLTQTNQPSFKVTDYKPLYPSHVCYSRSDDPKCKLW